jgi:hypothetical protein
MHELKKDEEVSKKIYKERKRKGEKSNFEQRRKTEKAYFCKSN